MHVAQPGWTVRAFRLDGTSIVGTVVSGPYRNPDGKLVDKPICLENGSEHKSHLCEPAGETLQTWADRRPNKVHFDFIAYGVINQVLGGSWSSHLGEYVDINWQKRTVKTKQLSTFVGSTRVYDNSGVLVKDDGDVSLPADTVLEELAKVAWAYQDDEVERLTPSIVSAIQDLEQHGASAAYIHLPEWAKGIWPDPKVLGLSFCKGPFPMVLSKRSQGRFAPITGIFP